MAATARNPHARASRLRSTRAGRSPGFTLIEMVVAVALLLLVMSMASTVFKVTLEGSGRLQQLSEIDRSIRMFKSNLARELGSIDSRRSIMAIQGNPAPAYWTPEQRSADYRAANGGYCDSGDENPRTGIACGGTLPDADRENPTMGYAPLDPDQSYDPFDDDDQWPQLPRADILMFVTNLPDTKSFVDPSIKSDGPVMIVYNHAERVDFDSNGAGAPATWNPIPTLQRPTGQTVARDWHLARRAVLLKSAPVAADPDAPNFLSPSNFAANAYLQGTQYNGVYDRGGPIQMQPPGVDPMNEWPSLLQIAMGEKDYVAPDPMIAGSFDFNLEVANRLLDPVLDSPPADVRRGLPAFWLMRSHVDPEPPAGLERRLSNYFLPNCASFKVEWTPNDVRLDRAGLPEVVWIDPFKEDPATNLITDAGINKPAHLSEFDILAQQVSAESGVSLQGHSILGLSGAFDPDPNNPPEIGSPLAEVQAALVSRFGLSQMQMLPPPPPGYLNVYDANASSPNTVEPSFNTHVWFARNWENGSGTLDEPDPMWPRAIRITIDLFDDADQFQTPVRHMFVLPVGSQGDPKKKLS